MATTKLILNTTYISCSLYWNKGLEPNPNKPVLNPKNLKVLGTGTEIKHFKRTEPNTRTLILKWKYRGFYGSEIIIFLQFFNFFVIFNRIVSRFNINWKCENNDYRNTETETQSFKIKAENRNWNQKQKKLPVPKYL